MIMMIMMIMMMLVLMPMLVLVLVLMAMMTMRRGRRAVLGWAALWYRKKWKPCRARKKLLEKLLEKNGNHKRRMHHGLWTLLPRQQKAKHRTRGVDAIRLLYSL
jgi:hypothetical protein